MRFIFTCACKDQEIFVKEAYQLLFPNSPTPQIYKGTNIYSIYEKYPNTNLATYAKALAKNKEKFAYYIETDENQDIIKQYNLKTGGRLI